MARRAPLTAACAVVVTHDSEGVLAACLDSLDAHGIPVVVSDSGSSDGVAALCQARGAAFLPGPNRGFGAAVNRALGHHAVRAAPFVLLVNPDVTIAEGALAGWIAECEDRPGCAVFAPRQVDQHGELVPTMGREPTPADYWLAARTLVSDWVREPGPYEREARCDWVMGSFMLVRREPLESQGGFDERFFLFSEEVDLCSRLRRAGWEIAYLPTLTVAHAFADRPLDPHRERLVIWSQLVYIRKWYGPGGRISMRTALIARLSRQLARRLRNREAAPGERARLGAALRFRPRRYGAAQR